MANIAEDVIIQATKLQELNLKTLRTAQTLIKK